MTEDDRLEELEELDILDSPKEKDYDDLVRLASAICGTPISLVTLVDRNRQWFKASIGVTVKETPRDLSFCAHAIQRPGLFIIEDTTVDERFRQNALVAGEPKIRFYAGVPLLTPGGAPVGTLCVLDTVPRVLTESQKDALVILASQVETHLALRVKERSLEQSVGLFRSFMKYGPFATYIKDSDGRMIFYNRYLAEPSGVSETEWLGLKDCEIWPLEMAKKFRDDDITVLNGDVPVQTDDVSPSRDGVLIHWKTIKFPYNAQSGKKMLAGISIDVTLEVRREAQLEKSLQEQKSLSSQLELLAATDSLTGLSARRVFEERARIEFEDWKRSKQPLSMFVMDIDGFKERNDTYGHASGDLALQILGRVLKECVRIGDIAARLGGEEFGVILPNTTIEGAQRLAQRFQHLLNQESAGSLPLTVSIGVAEASGSTLRWPEILSSADEAMYAAKRAGKNRIVVFSRSIPLH